MQVARPEAESEKVGFWNDAMVDELKTKASLEATRPRMRDAVGARITNEGVEPEVRIQEKIQQNE